MKPLYIILLLLSGLCLSCSENSMEDDAREAAELSTLSNQYSMENNVAGAGAAYKEVQEIMDKYKKQGKFDEFYKLYSSFLEQSSYRLEEAISSNPD